MQLDWLAVLLHNCWLCIGVSIIPNQKTWVQPKNYWVNWPVLSRSITWGVWFLSVLKIGSNKKLKIKVLNTKNFYLCIYIARVLKESLVKILCCCKLTNLTSKLGKCRNKITGTDLPTQIQSHFGRVDVSLIVPVLCTAILTIWDLGIIKFKSIIPSEEVWAWSPLWSRTCRVHNSACLSS